MSQNLETTARPPRSPYYWANLALVLILACLVAATFSDYGITWDEPLQQEYGERVVEYFRALTHGEFSSAAFEFKDLYFYGGLFDSFVAVVCRVSPLPTYDTRHLITALVGLIGVVGGMRLASYLGGARTAFWTGLLIALTPRFYGHMFNNPKDIPFAAGFVWAIYYLTICIPDLRRIPLRVALKLGATIGLTMSVRVGGAVLLVYFGVMLVTVAVVDLVRSKGAKPVAPIVSTVTSFLIVAVPAYLIMLSAWPWAQASPLRNPIVAFERFKQSIWFGSVQFAGREVDSAQLPASYLSHYLGITLPEVHLVLLFVGLGIGIFHLVRKRPPYCRARTKAVLFVTMAAIYPLLHIAVVDAVVYDGMRHVLFIIPLLSCLAALVLTWLMQQSVGLSVLFRRAVGGGLAVCLALHVGIMVRLHPYQTVYFNALVGGLRGAAGSYDTDYWANSYREAVSELTKFVESKPELMSTAAHGSYNVWVCPPGYSASYLFPDYLRSTPLREDADFLIGTTRWNCDQSLKGDIIVAVQRFGVPLSIVKRQRRSLISRGISDRVESVVSP